MHTLIHIHTHSYTHTFIYIHTYTHTHTQHTHTHTPHTHTRASYTPPLLNGFTSDIRTHRDLIHTTNPYILTPIHVCVCEWECVSVCVCGCVGEVKPLSREISLSH